MWIGLRDVTQNSVFRWMNGDVLHYNGWGDTDPDGGQYCVVLLQKQGHGEMADKNCIESFSFLCSNNSMYYFCILIINIWDIGITSLTTVSPKKKVNTFAEPSTQN